MRTKFFLYQVSFLMLAFGYSCKKDKAPEPQDPQTPQNPQNPFFNISRTDLEVGNDVDYTDTVVVRANIGWTINIPDEAKAWLSVEYEKRAAGDSSTVVTIRVTAANKTPSQTTTITITPAISDIQPRQINIMRKSYSLVWQKCYGGSGSEDFSATVWLPNGQFITTGESFSNDGDALGNDIKITGWALRMGSDANKIWQKQMGKFGSRYLSIVASSDGGTVSAGYFDAVGFYKDLSLVKFDASGNVVWNKTYGGSNSEYTYKIINATDGGYLVAGESRSNDGDVKTNQGGFDSWVMKLDADGNLMWGKTFGGADDEAGTKIAACSDGGYIILSTTKSNNSGDVPVNHGMLDLFVVKIDANGNKLWSKTFGGAADETATDAIGDTDGGCILLGYTRSNNGDVVGHVGQVGSDDDMWVLKLTKDGQIGWQATLGGSRSDIGKSIVRLPNGNLAIGGSTYSEDHGITGNHGAGDVWVVVLNNKGKLLWQKTYGSSTSEWNRDINAAADGSILVTNMSYGNDGDISGNHGSGDGWIFKLQ